MNTIPGDESVYALLHRQFIVEKEWEERVYPGKATPDEGRATEPEPVTVIWLHDISARHRNQPIPDTAK